MSRLSLLTDRAVSRLISDIERPGAVAKYRAGTFEFGADDQLLSTIEVSSSVPVLESSGSDCDANASVALYRWLGSLEDVLATDERLWVALSHGPFSEYTRARWPVPPDGAKAIASVRSHWFVGGGLGGLRRNSVARLWWAAHLTYAPWEDKEDGGEFVDLKPSNGDPFTYTKILLRNQNVYQALLEREFGSSRRVLIAMLEVIGRDETNRATDAFSNALGKQVNLLAAFREISALPTQLLVNTFEAMAVGFEAGSS